MKYLIFIGLFVAGGLTGYLVGINQSSDEPIMLDTETHNITEFIHDTIVQTETIEIPVYIEEIDTIVEIKDTIIEIIELDTLTEIIKQKDTLDNNFQELNIKRDELILSKQIPIQFIDIKEEKDSIIKDLLGIKESNPTDILVQFWESPIHFSGYKLSKNTLIAYGLSIQFDYKIYYKGGTFYLSNDEVFYILEETNKFIPYQQVEKATVLDD